MAYVVEMTGYDPVNEVEVTSRFAMGEGIAFSDVDYAYGGLLKWDSTSQKIDVTETGSVAQGTDNGELTISNQPPSILEPGPWDDMVDWIWQGQTVKLYWVEGTLWSAAVEIDQGILEQPWADLNLNGSSIGSAIRFQLRDPRQVLDVPLQPIKLAGDNVDGAGVEGGPDVEGQPRPIIYGLVSNISPPRVNEGKLIYIVADKPVSVLCVRDGGNSIPAGTIRGSLASLEGTDPDPGTHDVYAGTEGTYIRLGTAPIYNLTMDADEALGVVADRSHGQIWKRFRAERTDGTTDEDSVDALDAIDPYEAGYYFSSEVTKLAAIGQILTGCGSYEVLNDAGDWVIEKLDLPTLTPVRELEILTPDLEVKENTRLLSQLGRVRPNYAIKGAPPYRVNVRWGHNYTIMEDAAFAGVADQRLKDKFKTQWRTATATDPTVWDPVTETGLYKNAPALTVDTGYQPGEDFITSPGATAEAERQLAIFSILRGQYVASYAATNSDRIRTGSTVKLTYPGMGLSGGAMFRVLQAGLQLDASSANLVGGLVIGLQRALPLPPLRFDITIIPIFGQSNSESADSVYIIDREANPNVIMLDTMRPRHWSGGAYGTEFSPARAEEYIDVSGNHWGGDLAIALGKMMVQLLEAENAEGFSYNTQFILPVYIGQSSSSIAQMSYGTAVFDDVMEHMAAIKAAADAAGYSCGIGCAAHLWGADGYDDNIGTAQWELDVDGYWKLGGDFDTHISPIFGQDGEEFLVGIMQTAAHGARGYASNPFGAVAENNLVNAQARYELIDAEGSYFYAGSNQGLAGSGVHHSAREDARVGAMIGYWAKRRLVDNQVWPTYLPALSRINTTEIRATISGFVDGDYLLPVPNGLTPTQMQPNYGLIVVDPASPTVEHALARAPYDEDNEIVFKSASTWPTDVEVRNGARNTSNVHAGNYVVANPNAPTYTIDGTTFTLWRHIPIFQEAVA
ncbi:MAG: hypothetical protein KKA05_10600 [Alphaproteobacteria bacterium]|nr:hypothetical protein [Alphaproteobacteria bacterium]